MRRMILIALCAILPVSLAEAQYVELSPAEAAVVPVDESGRTGVAYRFDLSGLPDDPGLRIDLALVEWAAPGIPSEEHSEFAIHTASAAWSEAGVAGGTDPSYVETPGEIWDHEARDYARNGGGLLRFEARALVEGWLAGSNHGVVIRSQDLDEEAIAAYLDTARLRIWFDLQE